MKTLIMNDSSVVTMHNAVPDYIKVVLTPFVDGQRLNLKLRNGTVIETIFESDLGAARIGFYQKDQFLLEALLLLSAGQGRQCWSPFLTWCKKLIAEGSVTGSGPLPMVVPDAAAWNCVVLYTACARLDDESLGELMRTQIVLAQAYVQRFDQSWVDGSQS